MPTIQQPKGKAAQSSKVQIPNSRLPAFGTNPNAPAQPHKSITTATKTQWNRDSTAGKSQSSRPLSAAAILSNPRLQQVTGLHPRKLSWWNGVQPPVDELARLQWVMNLPDPYPLERPKGNCRGSHFRPRR